MTTKETDSEKWPGLMGLRWRSIGLEALQLEKESTTTYKKIQYNVNINLANSSSGFNKEISNNFNLWFLMLN